MEDLENTLLANAQLLARTANSVERDPSIVLDLGRFQAAAGADNMESRDLNRLRYFAMAKVTTDDMVKPLLALNDVYPPYGLSEIYRDDDMEDPGYRAVTSFEPDGTWGKMSPWEILRNGYRSKIGKCILGSLEASMQEMPDVVRQLSVEPVPGYYFNHGSDVDEAYARLSQQAYNAVNVIVGTAKIVPDVLEQSVFSGELKPEDIIRNSKQLLMAMSFIPFSQLQHLTYKLIDGQASPGGAGWEFQPENYDIEASSAAPTGSLVFAERLQETGVTPFVIYYEYESTVPIFNLKGEAGSAKLSDIKPGQTPYGCPAHRLISAMCDDIADIADRAGLYRQQTAT